MIFNYLKLFRRRKIMIHSFVHIKEYQYKIFINIKHIY